MTMGIDESFDCTEQWVRNNSFPQINKTCFEEDMTGAHPALINSNFTLATIYIGIMSVALLIGTFGNIMILMVAGWARRLNKVGKEFMVNLALADFCVSAIADPMCIVGVVKGQHFFDGLPWLCQMIASMCLTACFCAFMSLTMLSVNRYVYLCHNSAYDRFFGRKTCIALCIMCWIVAFLCESPNFFGWGGHYFDTKNHQCIWDRTHSLSYTLFVAIVLIGSPLLLMTLCYILIFRRIWVTKKSLYDITADNKSESMTKVMKETIRSAKTIFVVFVVFVVCWTPYAIVIAIDVGNKLSVEIHLFITLLAHLHSSMNFIIYLIFNNRFRFALASIWGCKIATSFESETKSSNFSDYSEAANNGSGAHLRVPNSKKIFYTSSPTVSFYSKGNINVAS